MAVHPLPVVGAALATFLVGGLWYSPIAFARPWLVANGLTEEGLRRAGGVGRVFAGSFLLALVSATNLAFFLDRPDTTIAWGAIAGALAAVWIVCAMGVTHLFERRPWKLFLIDAGYHAVTFPLMGVILAAWRG